MTTTSKVVLGSVVLQAIYPALLLTVFAFLGHRPDLTPFLWAWLLFSAGVLLAGLVLA